MAQEHVTLRLVKPSVVVIGGGLAGMAAACYLLDAGHPVTLVEKRSFLGGRAFSFQDAETGSQVDNGQHVFLGCCTYYIDFLKKLGTFHRTYLQKDLYIRVLNGNGKTGMLKATPMLPAPLHLLPSFLRYTHLSFKDRLLAIYALLRIRFTDRQQPHLEEKSFYQWLKEQKQSERCVENLWNLIIRPTLNDDVRNVSASMGMMVFQETLLRGRHNANIGYFRAGLSSVMGEAAAHYIAQRNGKLIMGRQATHILCEKGRGAGVRLDSGETLRGDLFVSALPFDILLKVLPEETAHDPFFARFMDFSTAPIVNIHLWYDRPVMEGDFVAFLDSPLQWVFNKSSILDIKGSGQYLCISLSGAWEYIDRPKEELRSLFIQEMARVFPRARQARVEKSLVIKQEQATFRCTPGASSLRPPAKTPIPNLYLAGEGTDTGWPSTMESAVRSGVKVGQLISSRAATDEGEVVQPLEKAPEGLR